MGSKFCSALDLYSLNEELGRHATVHSKACVFFSL